MNVCVSVWGVVRLAVLTDAEMRITGVCRTSCSLDRPPAQPETLANACQLSPLIYLSFSYRIHFIQPSSLTKPYTLKKNGLCSSYSTWSNITFLFYGYLTKWLDLFLFKRNAQVFD